MARTGARWQEGKVEELTHGFVRAYGAHEILYFNVGEAAFITFNVFLPFSLSPRKRRRPFPMFPLYLNKSSSVTSDWTFAAYLFFASPYVVT